MWNHLVAVRVFAKTYNDGVEYDVVVSKLSSQEWQRRWNAPSFVLFFNEDMDTVLNMLSDQSKVGHRLNIISLVKKGVQATDVKTLTQHFSLVAQLFKLAASYNTNKDTCHKARKGSCSITSMQCTKIHEKDVAGFGTDLIRFSTTRLNLNHNLKVTKEICGV